MLKMKKLTAWVMTIFLTVLLLIPGTYVKSEVGETSPVFIAIGDSISYGYSADNGKGYVDLLYNYLKVQSRYTGLKPNNLSIPGITTTDFLHNLSGNAQLQNSIKSSNIITLSIGGNNLLGPVIGTVATAFSVNPVNNSNLTTDLSQAINNTPEAVRLQIYAQLLTTPSQLSTSLAAGVGKFNTDFPNIIVQVKALAPQAKIYVLTLYNPFSITDQYYPVFDGLIQTMNSQIKAYAVNNYEVIDVYNAFNRPDKNSLVNFNFLQGDVDPHPTNEGHKVIFESHITTASSVTLSETFKTLENGQALQLTAAVSPVNTITNPDVVWKSSNNTIAMVDKTGKVTAVGAGTATITVTTADGSKTAQCSVTINNAVPSNVSVTELNLDKKNASVQLGTNITLTASVLPNNATNKKVTWSSNKLDVATVDQTTGKVTGVKEGIAIITATTEDGAKTAQCEVNVTIDECFIATAAYGSKFQSSVVLLRHFRDDYLLTNTLGAEFVKFYYKNSPPIAKFIAHNVVLKNTVKVLLTPFVGVVYGLYHPVLGGSVLLVISILILVRRKYKPQNKLY